MNCQNLFPGKNKKNISKYRLLKCLPTVLSVKYITISTFHFLSFITGQSADTAATKREASKLRGQGVTVFSVGVGSGFRMTELNSIATDPDKSHVFTVTSYNALDSIKATLSQKTCEGMIL